MVQIETEQDIEVLRQMARLLAYENQHLHRRIQRLTEELARGGDTRRLQLELDLLKDLLARRERALFGSSSEKRPGPDPADPPVPAPPPPPRRGHGPWEQPNLPVIEQPHVLPEDGRDCLVCGGIMEEMGEQTEDAEEISVVERRFVVVRHRRRKYRCRCNACVVTAPGPPKLQSGSRYSPEFAVEVAVGKYADHAPLERQVRIMEREGLGIDSQTLFDQMFMLTRHLLPSYEALGRHVLASPLVHADETHWKLLDGREAKRWWVWGTAREDAVVYRFLDSRSQVSARAVLEGYEGTVMADGYGAYEALRKAGGGFRLVHCWAHVRRKAVECEANFPRESREMIDQIGALYEIERQVPRAGPEATEEERAERLDLIAKLRRERSRPIVDGFRAWAAAQLVLPESGLGRAIGYMLGLWDGLVAFLDDPRVPLDNNLIERGMRGVVLSRKNHYGSKSRRGTEVAAILYSLIESAKLCGVEPKAYLLRAVHAAIAVPGTVTLPLPTPPPAN
jgi:transposase